MGRILALDIGEKKTGIAVTDPSKTIASPHSVIRFASFGELAGRLAEMIQELDIESVVVGVPKSLSGQLGRQEQDVRQRAAELARELNMEFIFVDERFSSKEANLILRSQGAKQTASKSPGKSTGKGTKKKPTDEDAVAASIILENYLRTL